MSSDRRDLYNGFGDTYSRVFEVVVTPFVFGLVGWFIDSRAGTFPVFALTLGLLVFGYEIWKLTADYNRRMDDETKKLLGGRDV